MRAFSRILLLTCLGYLAIPVSGQINNTLYFMPGVPQTSRINPSYQPAASFYIGFPLVAPARGGISTSSLAYSDVIQRNPEEKDSLILFLHPLGDTVQFYKHLKPVNLVVSNLGTSLISFGFGTDVGFFSVDVSTRFDGSLRYPGDLAYLLVDGTQEGKTYEMDGLGMDLSLFTELSVGWSRVLSDNLSIGARAKMFFGMADFYTRNSELSITTSEAEWDIQSDMQFNTSLGFGEVVYDDEGNFEEIIIEEELKEMNPYALARYAFGTDNLGFGLDLGLTYRPIEPLVLSASVVDLAFIRWKDEVHSIEYTTEYNLEGVEIDPLAFGGEVTFGDYIDSTITQMADSLAGFLVMQSSGAYSKRLNTKLYVGASYYLTPNINLGLLSRTDFLNDYVSQSFTASANFTTGRILNLGLSYSYMHGTFRNIGAALSMNMGPVNLYMGSDNILNMVFWPVETRAVNIWVGLNFVFGYKEKLDYPLVQ